MPLDPFTGTSLYNIGDKLRYVLPDWEPDATPPRGVPESVGAITPADLKAFHARYYVARNAVLSSKLPESVPATSIDRQCGSSQQALHFAGVAVDGVGDLLRRVHGEVAVLPAHRAQAGHLPHQPLVHRHFLPGVGA